MRIAIAGLLLSSVTMLPAAESSAKVWTGAEVKSLADKMAAKKEKVGTASLGVFGNYQMSVLYRSASGEAELHQTKSDVFYIVSGGCTLVTGGTVSKPRTTQPHEIRGPAVSGGQKRKLGPGDFVTIPAGVPHQLLLDPGGEIAYAVVKVNSK
jgi:mannose-6-phosphate isomerase-like protein (cupin superfamily)